MKRLQPPVISFFDFALIFDSEELNHDMSKCVFICLYPTWLWGSEFMALYFSFNLEIQIK